MEIPHANLTETESKLFSLSSGSRLFTRYGYGDFLHEGAPYKLLFRVWPGTQRHLLSVDPEMAAAYSRTSSFCGAAGLDLMEPLTFKGREGTGVPGGRCAYADASLNPHADWQKYEYYYRVWGRKLYNPDAQAESWQRYLRSNFGAGALAVERSLANASRILPLLTSAHLDSASNHDLWYEMHTNMPIVEGSEPSPYGDTPVPKLFGTVSPLDPQLFSTVREYSRILLARAPSAKYSPIEVAQWIEDCVAASQTALNEAQRSARSRTTPEFRRIEEDVLIQIGVGTFFSHKLRSAVLYEVFQETGNPEAGRLAVAQYQQARDAWAAMAQRAARVYKTDVSYGDVPKRRGHWRDRVPGIDTDLAAMKARVAAANVNTASGSNSSQAVHTAGGRPTRLEVACSHTSPQTFVPGQPLSLALSDPLLAGKAPSEVRLYYRHVNQAERWNLIDATGTAGRIAGTIPASYTKSEYALQYYFELQDGKDSASLYPGFNKTLSNQPYFVVHQTTS